MLKIESRENRGEKIKEKDIVSSKSLPYPPVKKIFFCMKDVIKNF